jgi:ABC-type multidrug transport system ATPase subunit
MDPSLLKHAIKMVAIYISATRGESDAIPMGSFPGYFETLSPGVGKRMLDKFSSDCLNRMLDGGVTVENIVDEALQDIKTSLNYKGQLELLLFLLDISNQFREFEKVISIEKVAHVFGVRKEDFLRYRLFVTTREPASLNSPEYLVYSSMQTDSTEKLEGRWIEDRVQQGQADGSFLEIDNFTGILLVMYLKPVQSFVLRCVDNDGITVDGAKLNECRFKIVEAGSTINLNGRTILTYSDIKQRYVLQNTRRIISLSVNQIQFRSGRTGKGIETLSVREQTGSLVGIVGKEGAGKTTLLKLLAGYLVPDKGNIEINGYDLQKNRYLLKDIIGYVPEEDLLFEELSVYDNLLLNARLYYSSLSPHEIRQKVDHLLTILDLYQIKGLVVGNVPDKNIQPGQRRILNIALELLRDPQLLLVDNALSGLSMADSSKVIKILHNYTLEGNLVITSVSQAGSNMFNHFDKVWILDDGGYPVYTGLQGKLAAYLNKHIGSLATIPEILDPATIIDLINHSVITSEDKIPVRVIAPAGWHQLYLSSFREEHPEISRKAVFPTRPITIPNLEVQFLIFSLRNFKCKFSRVNNLIYTLLSGPIIALILGFFLRKSNGEVFVFSENNNLPAYQFISVITAMFLGIVISVGEILKERNIILKEQFLQLNRFSYINSKIVFLLLIVALQTFLYTIVGNALMGITGMMLSYWLVLFSVACFGVLVGLLFSSGARKLSTLYEKIIPIFLALQVIFGGSIISYHALNLEKTKYVPMIGELMVSRWGYEALGVIQFSKNQYQQNFQTVDKNISRSDYYAFYLIPELEKMVDKCRKMNPENDSIHNFTRILYSELNGLAKEPDVFPFEFLNALTMPDISQEVLTETHDYITYLELFFYERHETQLTLKNQITRDLIDSLGQKGFDRLKNNHFNYKLERIVTNYDQKDQIELIGDRFVRFRDGIYQTPVSNYGRAIMFTPRKIFNGQEMDTLWFNISIIWMFSTLLYLLLLTDAINHLR